ncbi:hypothetical protein ACFX5U_13480 [Sphingobacterium sp. SG20118]|uniref:hypothetical protein n=1 Tax=Sphingobacterium TaxID=28453 RepID=UPI0004F6D721|nr:MULTISPECIES: hypothetical protein [Sphingobacterium]AIM37721.1 hypothetical protein KO02_14320 [Sphingobacterium sp. ML3W]MDH5826155.1 hypothetical protein [Sphingobacterium faecium]
MAKSIKLTQRVKKGDDVIERPIYFIAENIVHFVQNDYQGRMLTTIFCILTSTHSATSFDVIESAEEVQRLIND